MNNVVIKWTEEHFYPNADGNGYFGGKVAMQEEFPNIDKALDWAKRTMLLLEDANATIKINNDKVRKVSSLIK